MKRKVEEKKSRWAWLFRKEWLIVGLILLVAAFLRLYHITSTPPGFHRDEALFGYEAYSIAKTARDEHGRFMPLWFEGFGIIDYPLAIYPRVPFIAVLGLSVFSVRFSLVFYSIITVLLIYQLARKLFPDLATAALAGFFAAFSVWHSFMSRYTISILGLMFLLLGVNMMLFGKRKLTSVVGGICLGLTCFTYAAYFFFLPLFLVLIFAIYFAQIKKDKTLLLGFVVSVLTMLLAFVLFWNVNLQRAPQSAFYSDKRGIEYMWGDKPVGEILAQGGKYNLYEKWLHYPRMGYVYKAATNYFDGFSTTFWLKTGRGFESNVDGFGNMLLYEPLLIIIGSLVLVWKRSKIGLFLIGWILIGPISSTFTKDVTSTRLIHMVAPFVLLEAVAIRYLIWDVFGRFRYKILTYLAIFVLLAPIVFLNVLYYDAYFRRMNAYAGRWWQKGLIEIVDLTNIYPEKQVYFKGKWDFGYIQFAFRNKYDPAMFQKEAKREVGPYNFNTVSDFGRYHFVDTEIWKEEVVCRDFKSIYIERLEENEKPAFAPHGQIKFLGSDTFVYYIPTAQNCAATD